MEYLSFLIYWLLIIKIYFCNYKNLFKLTSLLKLSHNFQIFRKFFFKIKKGIYGSKDKNALKLKLLFMDFYSAWFQVSRSSALTFIVIPMFSWMHFNYIASELLNKTNCFYHKTLIHIKSQRLLQNSQT